MDMPNRVLHVVGIMNFGGAESMIMNLYRHINKKNIQFDFIVHSNHKGMFDDEIESLGGKIYHFPSINYMNLFKLIYSWNCFFFDHPEYKILHTHIRSYACLYIPIAKKRGVKTIVHSHSTSDGKGLDSLLKRIMQYPIRYQADYLMSCSQEAGRWLFGKRSCQRDNYFVFPNGIDISRYRLNEEIRQKYRRQFAIEDKIVVGHVGRFHKAKNHLFLLDVFERFHLKRENAVLVLVGDGDLRSTIEAKILQYHLGSCVILTGNRNDVPELMQMMDVFIFPSLWEGLPVAVVEAQAAGLPCFVSDSITEEVIFSGLVKKIAIDKGPQVWIDAIENSNLQRGNPEDEIDNAGFNVKKTSEWLDYFYNGIVNGKICFKIR